MQTLHPDHTGDSPFGQNSIYLNTIFSDSLTNGHQTADLQLKDCFNYFFNSMKPNLLKPSLTVILSKCQKITQNHIFSTY